MNTYRLLALALPLSLLALVTPANAQVASENIVIRPAEAITTLTSVQIDVPVTVCDFLDPMTGTSTSLEITGTTISIAVDLTQFICFSDPPVAKAITFTLQQLPSGTYIVNYARSVDGVPDHQASATFSVSADLSNGIVPVEGMWWNPAESGSGYAIDVKHDVLVMTVFSYTDAGSPQWYLLYGPLRNNSATGKLLKFAGGQCISCDYRLPSVVGDDGMATVTFTSPTTATLLLPGGRTTQIVPQEF